MDDLRAFLFATKRGCRWHDEGGMMKDCGGVNNGRLRTGGKTCLT